MNAYKKTYSIFLILLFSLLAVPIDVQAHPCCEWSANGCDYTVLNFGGDSPAFIDCGDGMSYYGSGSYGGCPGTVGNCHLG